MEETGEPSPPFAIVLSNLWIAYGFIQTVLERRPGDVHRLVRVVIEFQQVREQKGLCYSIYSYGTCHDNTGYFGVYTALGRETEGQALDTILAVIREPTEHGVTQAELDRAREQSKANVLMGLESTQSRMSSLGRGALLVGRVREILEDNTSPVLQFLDKAKTEKFLESPSDYGKPWYGQLMAGPQMLAYMIQVDYWLKKYNIEIV